MSGRIRSALRDLWRFWLIVILLSIVGVVLAAAWGKLQVDTLPQLIVLLSNTYGLVAVVALLGYGLVEVPRVMWRRSFPESRFTWHLHRVGRAAARLDDAAKELERCLAVVLITSQQVHRSDTELRRKADDLVEYTDRISPVPLSALAATKIDIESLDEKDLDYAANAAGLAKLRGRIKLSIAEFVGSRGDYVSFLQKAMELEALCKSRQLKIYLPPDGRSSILAIAAWKYNCTLRPYIQRCSALILAALSITIVWCEATIGSQRSPDLSPFSLAIHDSAVLASTWGSQILVAAPLAYICAAAYFSLFKLGSVGSYHIVPRATWSWSLLLNGSLLSRFAAPLAFNYLHVIRMTGSQPGGRQMVFVNLMGMEDVPLLGAGFNTWFPLIMVLYVGVLTLGICAACTSKICNSSLAKMVLPARIRINGELPDAESTARGQVLLQAEHEMLRQGGELGEATQMFGMMKKGSSSGGGGSSSSSSSSGRVHGSVSGGGGGGSSSAAAAAAASNGLSSSVLKKELELRPTGGSGVVVETAASMRQPLFGSGMLRSDGIAAVVSGEGIGGASGSSGGGGGAVSRSPVRTASASAGDDADQLFAGVGRSSRRRGAWDV